MSLYKEKKFKLNIGDRTKKILIAIAVFILIVIIFFMISAINFSFLNFEKENISVKFSNSPYIVTKHNNPQIIVTVTNDSEIDAVNTKILIEPVEDIFYVICPNTESPYNLVEIPIMSKENKRTIVCDIKTTVEPLEILDGTYSFDITYTLNQIPKEHRAVLEVRKK